MPAQLQPQAQLAVMREQHAAARAIHQPAGRRVMARRTLAQKRVFSIGQQLLE
jgi:hypothetical protein